MNLIRFKEKVPSKLLFPLINTLSSASFAFVKTLQVFFPPQIWRAYLRNCIKLL